MPLPLAIDGLRISRITSRAAVCCVLLIGGCTCGDDPVYGLSSSPPAPNPSPSVARIEIIPGNVAAVANSMFEMRVRLWDGAGNLLPESYGAAVQWTISAATSQATLAWSVGSRVLVTVAAVNSASPYKLTALEPSSALSKTVDIKSVELESPENVDWVAASHDPKAPPILALVDGFWTSFKDDELFAFAGAAPLGRISAACSSSDPARCGELTLFSTTRALDRGRFQWTGPTCDTNDRRDVPNPASICNVVASGVLNGAPSVSLNVWILHPLAPAAEVAAYIQHAKDALRDSWAGVALNETIHDPPEVTSLVMDIDFATAQCGPLTRANLEAVGVGGFGTNVITLVIAKGLSYVSGDGSPVDLGMSGYACPHNGGTGSIVAIDWENAPTTTIAHELGHALGPWEMSDSWGHSDGIVGVRSSNVLYSWHDYSVLAPRTSFTLGQSFRFSLDRNALVRRGTPVTLDRCAQAAAAVTPCPAIAKDVP
jgi:hypothetical protein